MTARHDVLLICGRLKKIATCKVGVCMGNYQSALRQQKYLDDMYECIGIKHGENITSTTPVPAAAAATEEDSPLQESMEDQ